MDQVIDVMGMDLLAGLVQLASGLAPFGVGFSDVDRPGEDLPVERLHRLAVIGNLHFRRLVEQVDDLFTGIKTERPEKQSAEYSFLPVDLCVYQFLLLVDFELEPAAPIGNDP